MSITTVPQSTDEMDERAVYALGLREMADWIEQHPELPAPYSLTSSSYPVRGAHGQIGFDTRAELEQVATVLGVNLEDNSRTTGQVRGAYRSGRVSLTLVWFTPGERARIRASIAPAEAVA